MLVLFVSLILTRSPLPPPPVLQDYAFYTPRISTLFVHFDFRFSKLNRTFFLSFNRADVSHCWSANAASTRSSTRPAIVRFSRRFGPNIGGAGLPPLSRPTTRLVSVPSLYTFDDAHWVNLFAQCREVRLLSRLVERRPAWRASLRRWLTWCNGKQRRSTIGVVVERSFRTVGGNGGLVFADRWLAPGNVLTQRETGVNKVISPAVLNSSRFVKYRVVP